MECKSFGAWVGILRCWDNVLRSNTCIWRQLLWVRFFLFNIFFIIHLIPSVCLDFLLMKSRNVLTKIIIESHNDCSFTFLILYFPFVIFVGVPYAVRCTKLDTSNSLHLILTLLTFMHCSCRNDICLYSSKHSKNNNNRKKNS